MSEEKNNWEGRQYDSFGPHFRIDSGNPQLGYNGTVVYDLLGSGADGNTSTVGMTQGGLYHMYNDQCIEIIGGNKVDGGGVCVQIIGTRGDVIVQAEKNGDVRIKGRNIILDATENIEMIAGGKVKIDSAELDATTQNTTRINARKTRISGSNIDIAGSTGVTLITPKGPIRVKRFKSRDVNWATQVFAGTAVQNLVKGG